MRLYHDYNLLKLKLIEFKEVDLEISTVGERKFSNQLWYLLPKNSTFAFFDEIWTKLCYWAWRYQPFKNKETIEDIVIILIDISDLWLD